MNPNPDGCGKDGKWVMLETSEHDVEDGIDLHTRYATAEEHAAAVAAVMELEESTG